MTTAAKKTSVEAKATPARVNAKTARTKTKATAAPAKPTATAARRAARSRAGDPLTRLRAVCFSLPEVTEKEAWGEPTFRVREKMFAMFTNDHHGDGRIAVWCKAPLGMQEILIDADPRRFFRPPYVGPKGWIGICLDGKVDWDEVHALLADAWRMTAPPRLVATLPRGD
jgi:hypothetical protein